MHCAVAEFPLVERTGSFRFLFADLYSGTLRSLGYDGGS